MHYHLVFDALLTGSQLAVCVFLPLYLLVPGAVGWALKRPSGPHSVWKENTLLFISMVGFAISLVVATISFVEYRQMTSALAEGDYNVTEGIVEDFLPMPSSGQPIESFRVGGMSFRYGSGWSSLYFNSAANRGNIHNRAQVRITHRGNNILRVEVL